MDNNFNFHDIKKTLLKAVITTLSRDVFSFEYSGDTIEINLSDLLEKPQKESTTDRLKRIEQELENVSYDNLKKFMPSDFSDANEFDLKYLQEELKTFLIQKYSNEKYDDLFLGFTEEASFGLDNSDYANLAACVFSILPEDKEKIDSLLQSRAISDELLKIALAIVKRYKAALSIMAIDIKNDMKNLSPLIENNKRMIQEVARHKFNSIIDNFDTRNDEEILEIVFNSKSVNFNKINELIVLASNQIDGIEYASFYKKLWKNLCVMIIDRLVYQQKFKLLPIYLERLSYFLDGESISKYTAALLYEGLDICDNAAICMYLQRGGKQIFGNEKYFQKYLIIKNLHQLSFDEQFLLVHEALQDCKAENKLWFIDYINESIEVKVKTNGLPIKLIKFSDYKAGLFNFSNWTRKEEKLMLPPNHKWKNVFPLFHWDSGSDPLSYYFYKCSALKKAVENKIRKEIEVPLIGSKRIKETSLLTILKKIFVGKTILREHTPSFLGRQRFDFFIKELNVAIEWNGEQHYRPIDFFGGTSGFKATLKRDEQKRMLCKENNIRLIELKYDLEDEEIKTILTKI